MSWDCVEVGLAGGEETISFGPRHETGSSLYQVDTLANICPREKVLHISLVKFQRNSEIDRVVHIICAVDVRLVLYSALKPLQPLSELRPLVVAVKFPYWGVLLFNHEN